MNPGFMIREILAETINLFRELDFKPEEYKRWNLFYSNIRKKHIRLSHGMFYLLIIPITFLSTGSLFHVIPLIAAFLGTMFLLKKDKDYLVFLLSFTFYLILPIYRIFTTGKEMTLTNGIYFICMINCFSNLSFKIRDFCYASIIIFGVLVCNNLLSFKWLEKDIEITQKAIERYKIHSIAFLFAQFFLILMYRAQNEKIIQEMWICQTKLSNDKEANLLLSLSHELQNPLNVLINNLEFTKEKITSVHNFMNEIRNRFNLFEQTMFYDSEHLINEIQVEIKVAKQSAKILGHTISNILDKAKLDVAELEYTPSPNSLSKTLAKYWDFVSYKLNKNGLNGFLILDTCIPNNLNIDPHFLLSLLLNLKTNAIKYSEGEDVQTIITWVSEDRKDSELCPTSYFLDSYKQQNTKKVKERKVSVERVLMRKETWTTEGLIPSEQEANSFSPYHSKRKIFCNNLSFIDNRCKEMKKFTKIDKLDFLVDFPDNLILANDSTTNEKGYLKIEVYDSGPGIADVTNVFNRAYGVSKQRLGLGLGLWVTKEMCKIMNAEIKVFTDIGKGSQFVILIPVESIPRSIQRHEIDVKKVEDIKVLIVDDDLFNREICKKYLHDFGIRYITEAQNGKEAYEAYKLNPEYNLAFMDLEMPIMGGKMSAHLIRKFEKDNSKTPVKLVIATGNCLKSEKDDCMDSKGGICADLFIRKPLSKSDFVEAINLVKKSFNC